MKENTSVIINQLSNGFLVREPSNGNCSTIDNDLVFRSMAELCTFLGDHFDHREEEIEVD